MSFLWRRQQRALGDTVNQLIPQRGSKVVGTSFVSADTAMRHSAVWACLALRANIVSTMPLLGYRDVRLSDGDTVKTGTALTPFLDDPCGDGFGLEDFLYSSQIDLDRTGNVIGLVTATDGYGLPTRVMLPQQSQVTVKGTGPQITAYRIGGKDYSPADVWHERAYTLPGMPLGLSPVSYAALTIGQYLSAQDFGVQWFANGRIPTQMLKNMDKVLKADEAQLVKQRYKEAVEGRDVFVTGKDWEVSLLAVNQNESQFIDLMRYGILDVARFWGVPGDLIDAEVQSSAKITYANITQRNLQLLIMNVAPTLVRRERFISRRALAKPRYVEFDPTSTLLRMDPQTRASVNAAMIDSRQRTPSEVREGDNLLPFTQSQIDEFYTLFGKPGQKSNAPVKEVPA